MVVLPPLNRNLKLLLAEGAVSALANGLLIPVLAPYMLHLGLKGSDVGLLSGIMGFSTALSLVPAAYLADAKGRKPLALAAASASPLSLLLLLAGGSAALATTYALFGFLNAAISVSLGPLFADSVERDKHMDAVFSMSQVLLLVFSSIGAALTWPFLSLSEYLGGLVGAYRATIVFSSILYAVCIPLLYGVKETRRKRVEGFSLKVSRAALKLAGLSALMAFGAGVGVWNINYWFSRKYGVEAGELGALSIAGNLMMATATALAPVVSSKLGTVAAVVLLQLSSIPLLLAVALSAGFFYAAAIYTLRSAILNATNPLVSSLQMRLVKPEERARMSMLNTLAWQVAGAAGTVLGGHLMDLWLDLPIYLACLIYLTQTIIFYAALRPYGGQEGSSAQD
ncbi:MAG: MFS transporter [Thermofilaceae archaeon]